MFNTAIHILLFVLIGTMTIASPFLHNHSADFHEHEECPAFLITALLSIAITLFYVLTHTLVIQRQWQIVFESGSLGSSSLLFLRRGPPKNSFPGLNSGLVFANH